MSDSAEHPGRPAAGPMPSGPPAVPADRARRGRLRHGGPEAAAVVGSGPNGLSAALTLALAGVEVTVYEAAPTVGGGMRTAELTLPGLAHDVCSAFHPSALVSPAFARFGLEAHGLRWAWPELDLVHVLDGGRAGVLRRGLDATADGLGEDGPAWRRLFGPLVAHADDLAAEVLCPILHVPSHPVTLARFGLPALAPATVLARAFARPETRALLAGVAAHGMGRLDAPLSSAVGLLLSTLGMRVGWPAAVGGSAAIAAALTSRLAELGGRVVTEHPVGPGELDELRRRNDVVLLDTSAADAARLLAPDQPPRVARAYRRFRRGPGAFEVAYAIRGGIPWANPDARRAGTVHVGGTIEEVAAAEAATVAGRMPAAPFLLVFQQYLADPLRSRGDLHPVSLYAHVPHGYAGDATAAVEAQLERFAPGFAGRVAARTVRTPADIAAGNANFAGGDIATGASDGLQAVFRPRVTTRPYATGVPGVYLCSAATPPGAGVHGMAGFHAARAALAG